MMIEEEQSTSSQKQYFVNQLQQIQNNAHHNRIGDVYESRVARPLSLDVCNLQTSLPNVDGIALKDIAGGATEFD